MPLSPAELQQREAEDAIADQQRTAERQAKQADREQKAAADAARKADLSRQELEFRAQGMIPVTTADGNLHADPLFEQKQADKAAKEQAKAAKESAALTAKQQRADLTRQGVRHAINPIDGTPIPFETADDVARRRTEAAQQRRNQKLDDEIRAADADHDFQLADYESKGFKPLSRGADGTRPLETKALPKLKQDALFALQTRLQEQAKAVSGDADWIPFNEAATPEAQTAKQRLEALSQPGAELSEDDLAELEANDATKPLVARIRGIQTQLAKDDEINTLTTSHKSRIASLKLKRANPEKWFETERQRRASLPPDQLEADLETSRADLDARRADLETRSATLNGQLQLWNQKLETLEAQAAERRQRGLMASEIVTYTREDGTTEDWPRDLAAQREQITAQAQNTHALQQDDWAELQLQDQDWQREAALLDEAAERLQTTRQEQAQTAKTQFYNRLRHTPGMEQAAGELEALKSVAAIRAQDLADMHPDGVPEEAQKALQDDIQQRQQAILAAGQQRQQAAQAAYQGLQTALRPDKDGNTKTEIEVRPTIVANLAEALQIDPQEAERLLAAMETLNWEDSSPQDVKEKTPEEFAAKAKAIRDSQNVGGFVSAIAQTAADIWQDKPTDPRKTRLLPNGAVVVNQQITAEKDYTAAVNASTATPEAKAEALARFPEIRQNAGAQVRQSFQELEGVYGKDWIKDWLAYDAQRPQDVSPEEWAMRFTEDRKNDSALRRVAQEIGWSFYKGGNQLRQQVSGLVGGITGSEAAMQDATWAGRKAQAMQTSKELYGSASDNFLRAGLLEMTPEVATSIIPAAGGAKLAQLGIRGLAATGAGARLFPALAAVLEGSSTAAQAVKATQTLTRAGLAGASLAGGAQTYGAQISDIYSNLRRQGIEHADALRMAQTPAILSAGVTAALTALGGASGVERLLVNPASAKALFAKQFETQMKRLGFVGQKFVEGGLREFALEELPDEIFSTWQSGVASHPDDPNAGRKALAEFLKTLPEFAVATGILGGAGEAISSYQESSVLPAMHLRPETTATAWSAIENHRAFTPDGVEDPNVTVMEQQRATTALYLAQGGDISAIEEGDLNAVGYTRDGTKYKPLKGYSAPPVLDIDSDGTPVIKDSYVATLNASATLAPVAKAIGMTETETRNFYAQRTQPQPAGQTQAGPQQPQPAAAQAPAPDPRGSTAQSPVQTPAGKGTQPTPGGSSPAQPGDAVNASDPASSIQQPASPADFLANHLTERGLPRDQAAAVAEAVTARPEFAGKTYEEIITTNIPFAAALDDLGITGSLNSKDVATNPLKVQPGSKLAKVKAEMEAKAAAAVSQNPSSQKQAKTAAHVAKVRSALGHENNGKLWDTYLEKVRLWARRNPAKAKAILEDSTQVRMAVVGGTTDPARNTTARGDIDLVFDDNIADPDVRNAVSDLQTGTVSPTHQPMMAPLDNNAAAGMPEASNTRVDAKDAILSVLADELSTQNTTPAKSSSAASQSPSPPVSKSPTLPPAVQSALDDAIPGTPSPEVFAAVKQAVQAKELTDQQAAEIVAQQSGAKTHTELRQALELKLGWKNTERSNAAAANHFGDKSKSPIPLAAEARAGNRTASASSKLFDWSKKSTTDPSAGRMGPEPEMAASPAELRRSPVYSRAKLAALSAIKPPAKPLASASAAVKAKYVKALKAHQAKMTWARQFFTLFEKGLEKHHLLYDALGFGPAAAKYLDGQMTAVVEINGQIVRLIDMSAMLAQFDYLQSPAAAVRATGIEEDIHATVLRLAREQPGKFGYDALVKQWDSLTPELQKAVWTSYRNINQRAANAKSARLPRSMSESQKWHIHNEFLRMLVQDKFFVGQITETVDSNPGLIQWVKDLLANLGSILHDLIARADSEKTPGLKAALEDMVDQIGQQMQIVETASATTTSELSSIPSLSDHQAVATQALTHFMSAKDGIFQPAALAKIWDLLDPSLQRLVFRSKDRDPVTGRFGQQIASRAPKHDLMRDLLAMTATDPKMALAVQEALLKPSPQATKSLNLLERLFTAFSKQTAQQPAPAVAASPRSKSPPLPVSPSSPLLAALSAQSPDARRALATLHSQTLGVLADLIGVRFVVQLPQSPAIQAMLEAEPPQPEDEQKAAAGDKPAQVRLQGRRWLLGQMRLKAPGTPPPSLPVSQSQSLPPPAPGAAKQTANRQYVADLLALLQQQEAADLLDASFTERRAALDAEDAADHGEASTNLAGAKLRAKLRLQQLATVRARFFRQDNAVRELHLAGQAGRQDVEKAASMAALGTGRIGLRRTGGAWRTIGFTERRQLALLGIGVDQSSSGDQGGYPYTLSRRGMAEARVEFSLEGTPERQIAEEELDWMKEQDADYQTAPDDTSPAYVQNSRENWTRSLSTQGTDHILLKQEALDDLALSYPHTAALIRPEHAAREGFGIPSAQTRRPITQASAPVSQSPSLPGSESPSFTPLTEGQSPFAQESTSTSESPRPQVSPAPSLAFSIPLSKRGQVRRAQFPDADSLAAFQFKLDADTVASARSTPTEVKKAEQRGLALLARLMEETGRSRSDLEKKLLDYHATVVQQAEAASAFGTFTPPSFASSSSSIQDQASSLPAPTGGDILSGMKGQGINRLGPPDSSDGWAWYRALERDAALSKLKPAEAQRRARKGDIADPKAKLAWLQENLVSLTSGRSIDEAATELSESQEQQFAVASGEELGQAILSALDARLAAKAAPSLADQEQTREKEALGSAQDFATYAAGSQGQPFTADQLSQELEPEDEIQIGSEYLTVLDADKDTGTLTLDSSRFGSVTVSGAQTLNLASGPNHLRISKSPRLQVSPPSSSSTLAAARAELIAAVEEDTSLGASNRTRLAAASYVEEAIKDHSFRTLADLLRFAATDLPAQVFAKLRTPHLYNAWNTVQVENNRPEATRPEEAAGLRALAPQVERRFGEMPPDIAARDAAIDPALLDQIVGITAPPPNQTDNAAAAAADLASLGETAATADAPSIFAIPASPDAPAMPDTPEERMDAGWNAHPEDEQLPSAPLIAKGDLDAAKPVNIQGGKSSLLARGIYNRAIAALARHAAAIGDMFFGTGTVTQYIHKAGLGKPNGHASEYSPWRASFLRQVTDPAKVEALARGARAGITELDRVQQAARDAVNGSADFPAAMKAFAGFINSLDHSALSAAAWNTIRQRALSGYQTSLKDKDYSTEEFTLKVEHFARVHGLKARVMIGMYQALPEGFDLGAYKTKVEAAIAWDKHLLATRDGQTAMLAPPKAEHPGPIPARDDPATTGLYIAAEMLHDNGVSLDLATETKTIEVTGKNGKTQKKTIQILTENLNEPFTGLFDDDKWPQSDRAQNIEKLIRDYHAVFVGKTIHSANSWFLLPRLAQENPGIGFVIDPPYFGVPEMKNGRVIIDTATGQPVRKGTSNYDSTTDIRTPDDLLRLFDTFVLPAWQSGAKFVLTNEWDDSAAVALRLRGATVVKIARQGRKGDTPELVAYNFNPNTGELRPRRISTVTPSQAFNALSRGAYPGAGHSGNLDPRLQLAARAAAEAQPEAARMALQQRQNAAQLPRGNATGGSGRPVGADQRPAPRTPALDATLAGGPNWDFTTSAKVAHELDQNRGNDPLDESPEVEALDYEAQLQEDADRFRPEEDIDEDTILQSSPRVHPATGQPLAASKRQPSTTEAYATRLAAANRKVARYKATGGTANWIIMADMGRWLDWNQYPTPASLKNAALKDFEATNTLGTPLTEALPYVTSTLNDPNNQGNPALRDLRRQHGNDPQQLATLLLPKLQEQHKAVTSANADYLAGAHADDPFFQSAMLRATMSDLTKSTVAFPVTLYPVAVAETRTAWNDGKLHSLPAMLEHYQQHAKAAAEIALRTRHGAQTVEGLEGGEWVTLPQVPAGASQSEQDAIFATWEALSHPNWCTSRGMARSYAPQGKMAVYRKNGTSLLALRFVGDDVVEVQSATNNGSIPLEYLPEVENYAASFAQDAEIIHDNERGDWLVKTSSERYASYQTEADARDAAKSPTRKTLERTIRNSQQEAKRIQKIAEHNARFLASLPVAPAPGANWDANGFIKLEDGTYAAATDTVLDEHQFTPLLAHVASGDGLEEAIAAGANIQTIDLPNENRNERIMLRPGTILPNLTRFKGGILGIFSLNQIPALTDVRGKIHFLTLNDPKPVKMADGSLGHAFNLDMAVQFGSTALPFDTTTTPDWRNQIAELEKQLETRYFVVEAGIRGDGDSFNTVLHVSSSLDDALAAAQEFENTEGYGSKNWRGSSFHVHAYPILPKSIVDEFSESRLASSNRFPLERALAPTTGTSALFKPNTPPPVAGKQSAVAGSEPPTANRQPLTDLEAQLQEDADRFLSQSVNDDTEVNPVNEVLPASNRRVEYVEPGFYSALAEAIRAKMPARGTPAQILGILKNAGLKAEEMKWTGIVPWLQAQAQDGPITQQQVLDYLATEGSVQFTITRLNAGSEASDQINRLQERANNDEDLTPEEWNLLLNQPTHSKPQQATRNTQWTLSGGTNPKEVVVTWNQPGKTQWKIKKNGADAYTAIFNSREDAIREIDATEGITPEQGRYEIVPVSRPSPSPNSDSDKTHYGDLDALAWYRTTDRTNAAGPGLLVEEFQSKWHQQGREKGYDQNPTIITGVQDFAPGDTANFGKQGFRIQLGDGTITNNWYQHRWQAEEAIRHNTDYSGVPDAPYRTAWPLMLFKRALLDAVAGNKSWIGWTTGDTQADRYDLSKQVSRIDAKKFDQTRYEIAVLDKNDNEVRLPKEAFTAEELPEIVGKELADRIVSDLQFASPSRVKNYTGLDLRVGGQGMRKFYDDILVKEFGKYAKQLGGGTVEASEVNSSTQEYQDPTFDIPSDEQDRISDAAHAEVARENPTLDDESDDYRDAVMERITDLSHEWVNEHGVKPTTTPIHLIRITPAMREAVTAGQALFSSSRLPVAPQLDLRYVTPDGQDPEIRRASNPLQENHLGGGLGANAQNPRQLPTETSQLLPWAQAQGWLIDPDDLDRRLGIMQEIPSGDEHDVWHDELTDRAVKVTNLVNKKAFFVAGSPAAYIVNLRQQNALFDTGVTFEGIVEDEGQPRIVTSMPWIPGTASEQQAKEAYFKARGFDPAGDDTFYSMGRDLLVSDARPVNVLQRPDGTVQPIDIQVRNVSPRQSEMWENRVNARAHALGAADRTPTQTIEATGLAPAISVNGIPYTGRTGMFHPAILGDYVWRKVFTPQQRRDDPNQENAITHAYTSWMDARGSGFDDFGFLDTRTGKFITREEAYALLTERGFTPPPDSYSIRHKSLDSSDLFNSQPVTPVNPVTDVPLAASPRLQNSTTPSLQSAVANAASQTDPNPTDAQKRAGNYAKGKVDLHGLRISIENPAGSTRSGTDANGKPWSVTLPHHYGYILGSEGRDGDHVDVFIGPNPDSQLVLIVNQRKPGNGHFDEHKVMLGFNTPAEAARGYLASYTKGWKGLQSAVPTTLPVLKHWITTHDTTQPVTQEQIQKLAKTLPLPTSAHDKPALASSDRKAQNSPMASDSGAAQPSNYTQVREELEPSQGGTLAASLRQRITTADARLNTLPGVEPAARLLDKATTGAGNLANRLPQAIGGTLNAVTGLGQHLPGQQALAALGPKLGAADQAAAAAIGNKIADGLQRVSGKDVRKAPDAVAAWLQQPAGLGAWTKNVVVDQLLPNALLPREFLALTHEMQRKAAFGTEKSNDLLRALSGNPRLSDLAYPKEFAENMMYREQMFDAMEGRFPMASLPPEMQRLAERLRNLLKETGAELVRQGIMHPDTFAELQTNGWMPRYTLDEAMESGGSVLAAFKLGVKDLLQQRSTAYHIVDTARKGKDGQPPTVNRREGGRNAWRFRDAASRDAFYHDFVRQQTLDMLQEGGNKIVADMLAPLSRGDRAAMRSQIKSLTTDQIANTAKLSPMLAGIVKQAKKHQYDRFAPKDPFEPEKLIKDPVYAIARYVLAQTHNAATMELLRETAKHPEWVSDVALQGFTEIPDGDRFGPLAGKFVQADIAAQILDKLDIPNAALRFYDAILRKWKSGKLVWNPGSHIRDAVGNTVFAYLGGSNIFNPGNWPYYQKALAVMRNGGPLYTELIENAVLGGDAYSSLVRERLKGLLPDAKTVENFNPGLLQRLFFDFGAKFHATHEQLAEYRRVPDDFYKIAAYLKAKDSMSAPDAAAHVRKWFPYYDRLGGSATTRAAGRFINPFLSFFRESTRILATAAVERPIALGAALAFPAAISALSAMLLGLDDRDREEIAKDLSGRGKGILGLGGLHLFSMLLPVRSSQGQVQQFDISAIMPFADLLGQKIVPLEEKENAWQTFWRQTAAAGPVGNLGVAWITNRDLFSGRHLVEADMSTREMLGAYTQHTAGVMLPPLLPDAAAAVGIGDGGALTRAGTRQVNKTLATYDPVQTIIRSVFGMNVKSAAPNLYRQADDFRAANGYDVQPGFDYGTTVTSRAKRLLVQQLAQDTPNPQAIANLVKRLKTLGVPMDTEGDIAKTLSIIDPAALIGGSKKAGLSAEDARQRFRQSLPPESRTIYEAALSEFQRIKRRAPMLIRQAQ